MSHDEIERISKITTMWSALRDAHFGDPTAMNAAQQLLLERYGPPVRRYLARLSSDQEARDDLWQEFATRLIQGDFRNIHPSKGKFRAYLKTVLVRMSYRQRRLADHQGTCELELASADFSSSDDPFDDEWRNHLIERTWHALGQARPMYEKVLRLRTELTEASARELAAAMQDRHGVSWSTEMLRQTLHRARQRYGELLLDEVAHSLDPVTRESVEDELASLELLPYCKPWLEKWIAS